MAQSGLSSAAGWLGRLKIEASCLSLTVSFIAYSLCDLRQGFKFSEPSFSYHSSQNNSRTHITGLSSNQTCSVG